MTDTNQNDFCKSLKVENIVDHKKLDEGIKTGWEELTNGYKENNNNPHYKIHDTNSNENFITKFRNMDKMDEELVLGILGVIRRHTVSKIFQCVTNNDKYKDLKHTYNAAGSTNLTSDYDLSISGPYSNEIMWEMFKLFLISWDKTMPHSFDTNIYTGSTSYYDESLTTVIPDNIRTFDNYDGEKMFLMVPHSQEDKNNLFTWACVKLIEAKIDETERNKLKTYLDKAKNLNDAIKEKYCDSNLEAPELKAIFEGKEYGDDTKKTVKNYYLQYLFGKPVEEYLHKRVDKLKNPMPINPANNSENNLFYLRGLNNFFSSEASTLPTTRASILNDSAISITLCAWDSDR